MSPFLTPARRDFLASALRYGLAGVANTLVGFSVIVALDERGKDLTTIDLSRLLTQWQQNGRDVTFVIGGADGLDAEFKRQADMMIRISSLTLPHGMVRVLLAEQLYRAWSITQNHPYHRV